MNDRRQRESSRNAGTFLALFALLGMTAGLLLLAALVIPQFLGIVVVFAAFVLVGVFHYCTWGWWLSRLQARGQVREADDADPRDVWPGPRED